MDPGLYRAAESGNWEVIKEFADFDSQQTPIGNTVLHVLAQSCDSSDGAKQILANTPYLALKTNAHLETPLHVAARHGHFHFVQALIDCAKGDEEERLEDMLATRSKDGNTALHEAVINNCYQAVKLLVEEAPNFRYRENFAGESPLYLAVEKANHEIAALILSTCMSPSYLGHGKKTALHIAVARNMPDSINMILEKLPNLVKEVDEFGWTALHYAAKFNHKEVSKLLLTTDKSLAYLAAHSDESKTALHVAVTHGHLDVIKEILLHCPDCWEMTTDKFQNILHLAAKSEHEEVLEFMLKNSWALELINQKDVFGETPPLGETSPHHDTSIKESIAEKVMQTEMIIATLIVTVTFAAGFTVPGGYDTNRGHEGMVVLSKNAAFTVFIISDSLALMASADAVFRLLMLNYKIPWWSVFSMDDENTAMHQISIAMTLMLIAFMTGLYAVLPNKALKIYLVAFGSVTCVPIYKCARSLF